MEVFFVTFTVFALMIGAMAIGAILRGRALKGSCGGLNELMGNEKCQVCDRKVEDCPNKKNL